jgi:hypothetical protein
MSSHLNIMLCTTWLFSLFPLWYPLRSACILQPEIDGVRILTNHACEFIHRVTSKFIIKHLAYGTHCHVRTKTCLTSQYSSLPFCSPDWIHGSGGIAEWCLQTIWGIEISAWCSYCYMYFILLLTNQLAVSGEQVCSEMWGIEDFNINKSKGNI